MRICMYTDSPEPSGMGVIMTALATELADVHAITLAWPPTATTSTMATQAAQAGIATYPLTTIDAFATWLRTARIEIVHHHAGIGWEGHASVYAARSAGVPFVLRTEHLPFVLTDPAQCSEYMTLLRSLDRLICVSESARDTFVRAGVNPALLAVVRNGLPSAALALLNSPLPAPPEPWRIITIGRLTAQKGYDVLLQTIPHVLAQYPATQWIWVGDGPLRSTLEDQIQQQGLAHAVQLLGHQTDIAALLRSAHLFVLASQFEGLPLVVLEAMAAGIPVVGTHVPGILDCIEHGVTGLLAPPDNPRALATTIRWALTDPALRQRLAIAAREQVGRTWTAQRMANDMNRIYQSYQPQIREKEISA